MLDSKIMKTIKHRILICLTLLFFAACDKDFVEVNTNPYAISDGDPALLFAGAQRSHLGNWTAEHTIVQHFVIPYNDGATLGFNFNADIDGVSTPKWDQSYTGPIRSMVHALSLLGDNTDRINLRSMIRIWKANVYMGLVDSYGDVPYFEAGKAVGDLLYDPTYDDDEAIYLDIEKELSEAIADLNPAGDYVAADLFYGANAEIAITTTDAQVAQWKKLGNSLLLRLGMRYSKLNPTKAAEIVADAVAGGVMTSNADNAYVKYDGTTYVQAENNNLRNFSHFNYAAEPFVNQLKATSDPRAKYIIATYDNAAQIANDPEPDTELANQFGVPIGVTNQQITTNTVLYRGANPKGGLNYSQMNINAVASPSAPDFYVTYAQTSLLLAEAVQRGWVSGSAEAHYENAIRADMQTYALYPTTTPITEDEITAYLGQPDVDFSLAATAEDAYRLINVQYWIVNIRNGTEAFANFRRSGYPALSPNVFNTNLAGGFARRLSYPDREASANASNYQDAASRIGGDNLVARVFWDVP
jgi:hypothetical protein